MDKFRFTMLPAVLVAFFAGLLGMPATGVADFHQHGLGIEHTAPYRAKGAAIRATVLENQLGRLTLACVCLGALYWFHPTATTLGLPVIGLISFDAIPSTRRVPGVYAEIAASRQQRGVETLPLRTLLIGQMTSAGTATANTFQTVSSEAQVIALTGAGSQLHRMYRAFVANNRVAEVAIGVLADNGGGTKASGTLTVASPATAKGTLHLMVAGEYVPVAVAAGDGVNAIAAAIEAAINANTALPVTADATDDDIAIEAKNAGAVGNTIDIRVNYQEGQAYPAGVSLTGTGNLTSGATNPTLTSLITALGDAWYPVIVHPYTDSTSLTAIENEVTSRFGPDRAVDAVAITCGDGSVSTLATLGSGRNCTHSVICAQPGQNPVTLPMDFAAAYAGKMVESAQVHPAQPMATLVLTGVLPPAEADLFTIQNRETLLGSSGRIATSKVVGGRVEIERAITTSSQPAWLDVQTPFTTMFIRYAFRVAASVRFARCLLADDGTTFTSGQKIVTPKIAKGWAIDFYRTLCELGWCTDFDGFKARVMVDRNASDRTRLDFDLPVTLVSPLHIVAAHIGFTL